MRLAGEWVAWCLDNGWPKSLADELEDLFWKYDGWKTFRGYSQIKTRGRK